MIIVVLLFMIGALLIWVRISSLISGFINGGIAE